MMDALGRDCVGMLRERARRVRSVCVVALRWMLAFAYFGF